ncbi:hypothetical protein ACFQU2_35355 [Siccirubricoccus deserti]
MALSELGQRFKRYARQKILDFVRADGPQLDKDATYRAIRQGFEGGPDAAAELDAVREGDTTQWLTWTQEAVAELVQAGILMPAEGVGQLQATELGIDLSRLPAGFRDTQKTRELSAAFQDVQPDAQFEKQARAKLDEFARRFPPERLTSLKLNDYAMGGGGQDNLSWWLERGLEKLGKFSPGNALRHLIYLQKTDPCTWRPRSSICPSTKRSRRLLGGTRKPSLQRGAIPTASTWMLTAYRHAS